MTNHKFLVDIRPSGAYITVTRLTDLATKEFFVAGHTCPKGMIQFMNSITDELAASYFPKPRKEKEQKNG